jgi:hypothetical protein
MLVRHCSGVCSSSTGDPLRHSPRFRRIRSRCSCIAQGLLTVTVEPRRDCAGTVPPHRHRTQKRCTGPPGSRPVRLSLTSLPMAAPFACGVVCARVDCGRLADAILARALARHGGSAKSRRGTAAGTRWQLPSLRRAGRSHTRALRSSSARIAGSDSLASGSGADEEARSGWARDHECSVRSQRDVETGQINGSRARRCSQTPSSGGS